MSSPASRRVISVQLMASDSEEGPFPLAPVRRAPPSADREALPRANHSKNTQRTWKWASRLPQQRAPDERRQPPRHHHEEDASCWASAHHEDRQTRASTWPSAGLTKERTHCQAPPRPTETRQPPLQSSDEASRKGTPSQCRQRPHEEIGFSPRAGVWVGKKQGISTLPPRRETAPGASPASWPPPATGFPGPEPPATIQQTRASRSSHGMQV
jgi:hypothetical protein